MDLWSELQLSVLNGSLDQVKSLIMNGSDTTVVPKGKIVPNLNIIHLAVISKNKSMLELLLSFNCTTVAGKDQA
jgi:ankyrin repeat protein